MNHTSHNFKTKKAPIIFGQNLKSPAIVQFDVESLSNWIHRWWSVKFVLLTFPFIFRSQVFYLNVKIIVKQEIYVLAFFNSRWVSKLVASLIVDLLLCLYQTVLINLFLTFILLKIAILNVLLNLFTWFLSTSHEFPAKHCAALAELFSR